MEPNLNIVTFALFCLPKSIFSNTILRLVISTWLNNTRVKTMSLCYLKACHWSQSHFFCNLWDQKRMKHQVWQSSVICCLEFCLDTVHPALISVLSKCKSSTNKSNRNWKNVFIFLSEDFNNFELEIRGNWVDFQM